MTTQEITIHNSDDLKNKIYMIRGVQVMLDSDLAEIYGYSVKAEYLKEFLSMPMKDLMNEVKVNELNLNKKSSKPDMQIDKTSISSESPSFPVEPQLSLGSRATHIILQNDTEHQAVIKKLNKIKTEKIESREFLIKLKEAYSIKDNRINNSKFVLQNYSNYTNN